MKGSKPQASASEVAIHGDDDGGSHGDEPPQEEGIGHSEWSAGLGTRLSLLDMCPFQWSWLCDPQSPWLFDKFSDGVFSF